MHLEQLETEGAHKERNEQNGQYYHNYSHCFYYYTHYFQCLCKFEVTVAVNLSYTLQLYVQQFHALHKSKG
jgi:hypothetical protein